jgi:hypothetical protein
MRSLIALAALLTAGSLAAQQTQPPGYKDPGIATVASILVAGGGQMYSGETNRGLTIFGVGAGSFLVGTIASATSGSSAPVLLGWGVYVGSWIYGIADASKAADRHNATLKRVAELPIRPIVVAGNSREPSRLGLSLSVGSR